MLLSSDVLMERVWVGMGEEGNVHRSMLDVRSKAR